MKYNEYKVVEVYEGFLGSIIFGSSKLPIAKITREINAHAKQGWSLVFQVIESKRLFLFWQRESMIITFGR